VNRKLKQFYGGVAIFWASVLLRIIIPHNFIVVIGLAAFFLGAVQGIRSLEDPED